MSYILDALKKADQQRQRAATPSLRSAPEILPEEKKSSTWRYAALAGVLVAAGALIGWLQTRDASTAVNDQRVVAARDVAPATTPSSPAPSQPSAPQPFPAMPSIPAPPLPLPDSLPNSAPAKPAPNASAHAVRPAGDDATSVAAEPQSARILMLDELPLSVRQSLPAMTVSLHAWSATPTSRIVSINNKILHEGDSPADGVSLEEITPDGMIMTFRGYRFRHGVR